MRIISTFKDYYDFPQKWGYDPHVVYERKMWFEKFENRRRTYIGRLSKYRDNNYVESYYIGFCGKLTEIYKDRMETWVFDYDKWEKEWRIITKQERQMSKWRRKRSWWQNRKAIRDNKTGFENRFEKAPLFLIKPEGISYNFCFKEEGLESFMEPLALYQKLEQYMSNEWAISQPDIPVPSDKDMVEIKGFDKKHSFRNTK